MICLLINTSASSHWSKSARDHLAPLSLNLLIFRTDEICLCAAQLNFDLKLTSDAKIQPAITGKTVAFDFAHHGHALVTLYVLFLCSDWSKFDR